jgi:hypothetical protein
MNIVIEPRVLVLVLPQLQIFQSQQAKRVGTIKSLIAAAEQKIEAEKAKVKLPELPSSAGYDSPTYSMDERRILQNAFQKRVSGIRRQVREELTTAVIPLLKEAYAAGEDAKTRAERHYDKFSIVRRTLGTQLGGVLAAAQMRAAYAAILAKSGPVELACWAQQSVDLGDAILADSVIRENNSRPVTERGFTSQAVLDALPNSEFDQLQTICKNIIILAEEAGLAWASFENDGTEATRRIALGLRKMQTPQDEGSIKPLPVTRPLPAQKGQAS